MSQRYRYIPLFVSPFALLFFPLEPVFALPSIQGCMFGFLFLCFFKDGVNGNWQYSGRINEGNVSAQEGCGNEDVEREDYQDWNTTRQTRSE